MSNRVHPIYLALDSHQYSKAVKLASALPPTFILGRALLAYALYKSGQLPTALSTVHTLLGWQDFNNSDGDKDIVERLEQEPVLIDWTDNTSVIPSNSCPIEFSDEATLETLAITLQGLNKFEMIYQLYAWAGHFHPTIRLFTLVKQYHAGLQLLVRSTANDSILASMQGLALQMARLSSRYTAWATRTALWQWQLQFSSVDPTDARFQMLPRLAESLAKKVVEQTATCTIEDCFLTVEIYKSQEKWNELLDILPTLVKLTPVQNLDVQATCWSELRHWEKAQEVYQLLLEKQPGQWSYWKSLIQCSMNHGGFEHANLVANSWVTKLNGDRPTRSTALVACELALAGLDSDKSSCAVLQTAIRTYAEAFASKASCVFSDLELYLNRFLEVATPPQVDELYNWATTIKNENMQIVGGEDRFKLRSLIFALQVMQKLAHSLPDVSLPSWIEIVQSWQSFPTTEGVQKENQPSDDLILLAVDQLLQQAAPASHDYLTAATLLEMGLRQSPFSPNLKLRLIGVYQFLNANDHCWALFRDLGIKHIQVDSCSYFILPILLEGGLYQQALAIANETLKFHVSTLSDTSDFVARALENGNWSKADEFLRFQRNRMNRSLSLLESKGVTMDCAPLMLDQVGLAHGIVGGEDDAGRAIRIMEEAHNTTGAPSIVSIKKEELERLSDNRDLSILPHDITATTMDEVIQTALRRKFYHGILIRAAAVLEVAKAPKKGKLAKTPEVLRLRCSSLTKMLEEDDVRPTSKWEQAVKLLAKVIVVVNAGLPSLDGETDSLLAREDRAMKLLREAAGCIPSPTIDITSSIVGRTIVDHLVTVMAITKMVAEIFLRFGWGKRKKRESVAALAQFAAALKTNVIQMIAVVKSLNQDVTNTPLPNDVLDETIWKKVCEQVLSSRAGASKRFLRILKDFDLELGTFEQDELASVAVVN